MANQTIYPYGVSAGAPTGLDIVNNLTSGGVDKALSAEQGKELGLRTQVRNYAQQDMLRQTAFKHPGSTWYGTGWGQVVNLLHFSDIHGDFINLPRLIDFASTFPDLDAILFTGDMVNNQWSDGIAFWENTQGAEDILVAVGNHDCAGKTAAECYGRYISPFVSNWGVTSQADLCYYYKDWATMKVRLIVLDCMHWDATQASWLATTLASAKTAGYHVVVANHYAPASSPTGIKSCSFDTLGSNDAQWDNINSAAPSAVQDFIDGGGKFVCWLCGHTHADMFRHPTSYPHQLYVAVANASTPTHAGGPATCQLVRESGTLAEDLFNLVSINTDKEMLTITRVGADHDTLGRHIGTVVYDYAENEIIWND